MGGLEVSKVVDDHEGWRLLSCMWLHGRVFHLLANMLSLLAIGIRLELEFGFVRIGLLYVISGFGGSLLSSLFIQSNISVGPSGALFGLLGAMLSELITNWRIYANKAAALITLVVIIAINLAVGILPNVDNFAHLGGFITGFLLGFVLLIRPQFGWISQRHLQHYTPSPTSKFKIYQRGLWVISLILLLVWLIAAPVMVLSGVDLNDNCSWCHYLSTFPLQRERSDQPLNFWALLHFFLYSSDAAPVVLNNVKLPVVLSYFVPISDKNKTVKRRRDSHGGAAVATAPKSNNVPQQSEKPVTSDELYCLKHFDDDEFVS